MVLSQSFGPCSNPHWMQLLPPSLFGRASRSTRCLQFSAASRHCDNRLEYPHHAQPVRDGYRHVLFRQAGRRLRPLKETVLGSLGTRAIWLDRHALTAYTSARYGLQNQKDSSLIRSTRCRDCTPRQLGLGGGHRTLTLKAFPSDLCLSKRAFGLHSNKNGRNSSFCLVALSVSTFYSDLV